ncbi:MAG TPA: DUF488 family protein [Homoserinimonas sp.]|nr:DUF488 family protein [Homoserinimonas sp.]
MTVVIKRVYDDPDQLDGFRVLVDRIWPRGLSKDAAHLDDWVKDAAPTSELRSWFGHDAARFEEFRDRYQKELAVNAAVDVLRGIVQSHRKVTLLYGARDTEHNQAVVLRDYLKG